MCVCVCVLKWCVCELKCGMCVCVCVCVEFPVMKFNYEAYIKILLRNISFGIVFVIK